MNIFEWENLYAKEIHVYEVKTIDSQDKADEIVKQFKEAMLKERVVLWGAGTVGRVFYLLLKELGISVEYVIDKEGDNVLFLDGIKVLSACDEQLNEKIQGTTLIVATVNRNLFEDVKKDILARNIDLSKVICGHNLHMVAQGALCMSKAYNQEETIIMKNCYECTNLDNTCMSLNQYLKRINGFKDEGKGTKAVKMIGYALSNICTLKCKHCCESVPYMPMDIRHFVPGENVVKDIKKLSNACNFITLLEFVGGEPFLHPELPNILNEVVKIKNIGIIHIFTNGTVIPNTDLCSALKNERITVYLSNYQATLEDSYIKKIAQTEQKLKDYRVNYFFGKKQNWMDFSGYDLVNSDEEIEQVYEDCFLHNCNRLQDGTLYICAHQYAGIALGKLNESEETIKIHDFSEEELGKKLEDMKKWKTIDACRYCTMPYKAKTVISGEQL